MSLGVATGELIAGVGDVVSGEGDEATGRCYLTVLIAGAQPQLLMTGRYRDTLRRSADGWRFVRRDFDADR